MLNDAHEAPEVVRQLCETCHDMREPVATMLALTAATLAEPGLPAGARSLLEQISGQAEWLAELIHEFLRDAVQEREEDQAFEISGIGDMPERGGLISHDAFFVVNQVVKAGQPAWACEVRVYSPVTPVRCTLHPLLLRRILSNVLSNAARAAGATGRVSVWIWRSNQQIRIVVEDSGPGFGNAASGLGLGLAWVARTIVKHGGRIECGPGLTGGARVSLWVP